MSTHTALINRRYGVWYSKYYRPGANESTYNDVIAEYKRRDLPLNVLVMDVGWHIEENAHEPGHPECVGYVPPPPFVNNASVSSCYAMFYSLHCFTLFYCCGSISNSVLLASLGVHVPPSPPPPFVNSDVIVNIALRLLVALKVQVEHTLSIRATRLARPVLLRRTRSCNRTK
jgi:hypothetical protein